MLGGINRRWQAAPAKTPPRPDADAAEALARPLVEPPRPTGSWHATDAPRAGIVDAGAQAEPSVRPFSEPPSSVAIVVRCAASGAVPGAAGRHRRPPSRTHGQPQGLAKEERTEFHIGVHGCEGDFNHYRQTRKGGTDDRAVSLVTSSEVEALRQQGWSIELGLMGENLSIEGLDWRDLVPGQRWSVGEEVVLQVTEPMTPCRNLQALPDVGALNIKSFISSARGLRGWYARVLVEGVVRVGDALTLLSTDGQQPAPITLALLPPSPDEVRGAPLDAHVHVHQPRRWRKKGV